MDTVTQQNEKRILKSFFYELTSQKFLLSVNEGRQITKINSFEKILFFYNISKSITIFVNKDLYRARAYFTFGNTELGIFCMYTLTDSLKSYITKTISLIAELALKKDGMYKLDQRIKIKEREREKEWVIIKEAILNLTRNGFIIKYRDGSNYNMKSVFELHKFLHDRLFDNEQGIVGKEPIYLNVFSPGHGDGFIEFMVGNGFSTVIDKYSPHLSSNINYVMSFICSEQSGLDN